MTSHENERIKRLERRLNWLRTRVYKAGEQQDLSFDKAEASALEWVINIAEKHLGVKDDTCRHIYVYVDRVDKDNLPVGYLFACSRCTTFAFKTMKDIQQETQVYEKSTEK